MSASYVVMLLVVATGVLFGVWMQPLAAAAWTIGMLCIHAAIIRNCSRFLAESPSLAATRKWRTRFVLLDLLYGLSWTALLIHPAGLDVASNALMMFLMLLVISVSSMLAASLPIAALAATAPVTAAIALNFVLGGTFDNYVLALLAIAAEAYFALLAHRLHHNACDARGARRKGRADRRARTGESDFRRGAARAEVRQRRQVALPGTDEPRTAHAAQRDPRILRGDEERDFRRARRGGLQGVFRRHPQFRCPPAQSHQRDPRSVAHRSRPLRAQRGSGVAGPRRGRLSSFVELRATSRGIAIHEVFEQGMPRIWGDEPAMRQIVLNLLSNSIKFTPQGGEIWLKAGWTASGGQYLSVKDTGSGIAEDEIPSCLPPSARAPTRSSRRNRARSWPADREEPDRHAWRHLQLKSKLRIGTEVIVTFPPERVMSALAPLAEEAPPLQPETVIPASTDDKRRVRHKPIMSAGTGL